MQNFGLFDL